MWQPMVSFTLTPRELTANSFLRRSYLSSEYDNFCIGEREDELLIVLLALRAWRAVANRSEAKLQNTT